MRVDVEERCWIHFGTESTNRFNPTVGIRDSVTREIFAFFCFFTLLWLLEKGVSIDGWHLFQTLLFFLSLGVQRLVKGNTKRNFSLFLFRYSEEKDSGILLREMEI